LAKSTGPNQFSLAVGHWTTAKVDDCNIVYSMHMYRLLESKTTNVFKKYKKLKYR